MSIELKRKLKGLWMSRTHWGAAFLSLMVGITPNLTTWLEFKLTPEHFALAGMVIYVVVNGLRWITKTPLEEKGE